MNIGDLFWSLRADGALLQRDVAKEGDKAGKVLGEHTSQAFSESIKRGFGFGVGIGLFHALQDSIGGVTSGVEGLIATSLAKAGEVERFTTQFEVLLGSVGAADERIRELVQFAATTPFELPQVIEASRTLQVFTQGALATGDGLRMVGDIAAGTGQPIQEVAMWVGRLYDAMQSGRPFGEASQRLQELGAVSGEDRALIERLAQSVKDGTMTMAEGWDAASATFSKFSGLMEKQSQTLEGQFSNLSDATGQAFAAVGAALLPIAKEVIPQVIALVQGLGTTIAAFIRDNAVPLRDMILSLTKTIVGFVSGLFGMNQALSGGAIAAVSGAAGAGSEAAMSFEAWRKATGNLPPVIDKTKAATKAATDAIDGQIASTQKAIDVEKRRNDGQETVFQRTMKRLADEYGARVDSLDLAEREIDIDARKRDLNEQLNQAQLDLQKAQKGTGGSVDAEAVSAAMANIASIQGQQAENERKLAVDTQKARLQATQSYIEDIANLEADSENKKALAANLGTRRTALQGQLQVATAAKDAGAMADITAKLEAVKTAEERTAQAQRSQAKQDELAGLKTQLEEQRKAIAAAGSGEVSDNKKKLGDLKAQYAAYLADQTQATLTNLHDIEHAYAGDAGKGTGLGGSITKAFTDGQAAGESLRKFIVEDLAPAFGKVVDFMSKVLGFAAELLKGIQGLEDLLNEINRMTGGASTEQRFGHLLKGGGVMPGRDPTQPGSGDNRMGGLNDKPAVLGESATVPSTVPGWMGGAQTIEVPVYLDGDVLTRVVSRRQADAMNR